MQAAGTAIILTVYVMFLLAYLRYTVEYNRPLFSLCVSVSVFVVPHLSLNLFRLVYELFNRTVMPYAEHNNFVYFTPHFAST